MNTPLFQNPYRPGAGHMPPYLAGRTEEEAEFRKLLTQDTILENFILTGLRGVGKTVLLERLKPIALGEGWGWIGTDLSEAASVNELSLALRILTDFSVLTSSITVPTKEKVAIGFASGTETGETAIDSEMLFHVFSATPGLTSDKLKAVLEFVWKHLPKDEFRGIIFAYDEAQNVSDHPKKEQYPLALLLDVFQSIQRKDIPFMLVLVGLPTLFPKLVEARTYAERMFRVVFLDKLNEEESRNAIIKPTEDAECPIQFTADTVDMVVEITQGYPYFIQFVCREVFDIWTVKPETKIPETAIVAKLDTDFFAGRWARATDRQRELLTTIANLETCNDEFAVQDIVEKSKEISNNPFKSSHANQMLVSLSGAGLIYKHRHGRYSFAVPLLAGFIRRQE